MELTATSSRPGKAQLAAPLRAVRSGLVCGALSLAAVLSIPGLTLADQGGVSFWLPGLYGSLAATPQQPGWSAAWIYYYASVSAGADVSLSRQFQIGYIPANLSAHANANLNSTADLGLFVPNYTFATPIFGGQAALSLMTIVGNINTSLGRDGERYAQRHAVRSDCPPTSASQRLALAICIRSSHSAGTTASTTT